MDELRKFWNTRTIYRKVVMVAMTLQLIGWFTIPFAEMYSSAATIKKALRGFGTDMIPEKFTLYNLGKFMMDMGSSEGWFYWSVIALNLGLLVVIVLGQKRASYITSYISWHVVALFAGIGISAGSSVYGYDGMPLTTMLIYAITAVVMIGCLLGAIFEYKAQAKLAARGVSDGGSSFDTEKFKAQAGNLADTGAAVAKKTAKMAVKGFFKASEAAKDFVESAKNESGVSSAPKSAPAAAPKAQTTVPKTPTSIPKSGTITGVKGMYAGAAISIVPGEFVIIGRSADKANLVIENELVGRQHCIIQYDGNSGNYIVTDCSSNGTFLGNGSRLTKEKPTVVSPGTVIAIVNKENTFQLG